MSDGYRNGAFAFGLIVGGGIALNLFLWLDYRANKVASVDSSASKNSQLGNHWDGLIGTFVRPNDTLAQWFMVLFTIIATVVLVLTLRSANKTNVAAIKASNAALEANDIMLQEQRPWVTLTRDVNCEFSDDDGYGGALAWNYNFINKGKTPAYNVKVDIKLFRSNNFMECLGEAQSFSDQCVQNSGTGGTPILFPGEETEFTRFNSYFLMAYEIGPDESGAVAKLVKDGDKYSALVCVTYRTGVSAKAPTGVETSAYSIQVGDDDMGPWRHKLIEWSSRRIVR